MARERFLEGYEAADGRALDRALLALFELHKAVYEIAYERAYRPDWLDIPVGGVQRVIARAAPTAATRSTHDQSSTRGTPMPADAPSWHAASDDVEALANGTHKNPHRVLGMHEHRDGTVVRVLRPDVASVEIVWGDGDAETATRTSDGGLFEALVPTKLAADGYRLRMRSHEDVEFTTADGLQLVGWYVPSRNGAAVISYPGRTSTQERARMLGRHGDGVRRLGSGLEHVDAEPGDGRLELVQHADLLVGREPPEEVVDALVADGEPMRDWAAGGPPGTNLASCARSSALRCAPPRSRPSSPASSPRPRWRWQRCTSNRPPPPRPAAGMPGDEAISRARSSRARSCRRAP